MLDFRATNKFRRSFVKKKTKKNIIANIQIYSNTQIFLDKYIYSYKYALHFVPTNIFRFSFDQEKKINHALVGTVLWLLGTVSRLHTSYIRHNDFRPSPSVTLVLPPPWILKRAGLKSSGQGLISLIG